MGKDLKILRDNLKGPILRISDPRKHSTEEIMSSYFRYILFLAKKFTRPTVEYEDLVVEGLIGLLDAIQRWDLTKSKGKENSFHNLAIVRIKSLMFEYLLSNNSVYTIPNHMGRAIGLVDQIRNLISSREYTGNPEEDLRNYESPSIDKSFPRETSAKIRVLKDRIRKMADKKTYEQMIEHVISIEQEMENYENKGGADITPEQEVAQKDFLSKFLNNLAPDARDVMTLRLQGLTLEEVGNEKGFTRERARQIEEDTLKFFRKTRMYIDAEES